MITLFGKNMCESCFAENDKDPCGKCGFSSADYQQDSTALPIGHKLQERYLIGGVIGKGGFGITYIAFDTKLERRVAVKEYYPYGLALRTPGTTMVSSPDADGDGVFGKGAEKFYDEARLVAKFSDNQNIVSIHDFFYENKTVYYVMEYLHGESMKKYVETHGVVSAEQAVYIAKEVSNALVSSHSANVLHRDIAPDNIMLCNNGKVKLIDFGAARQVISEGSQSLSAILKQGFAPLEQYQKKGKQGPWTDIYALGTTIYYLMTGDLLDDPITRMDDDEAFSSNMYNINDELWTVIKKATMLKPADRYKDIFEFRDALNKTSLGSAPLTISYDAPFKIKADAPVGATMPVKEASPVGETMPAKEASPVGATMPAKEASPVGATMPVKEASPVGATMPVKEASPIGATMPAKETSPIGATMPVKNTSDMRTMPVYDSAPHGSEVPRGTEVSARNKFIPIISILSAIIVVLVIGMIAVLLKNSDESEIIADETDIETSATYEETSLTETTSVETPSQPDKSEPEQSEPSQPDKSEPEQSKPSQPDKSEPERFEPSQPDKSEPEQSKPPQTSKTVTEPPKPAETTKPPAKTTKPPAVTKTANGEYVIAGKTFSGTETYVSIMIKDLSVTEELDQLANFKKLKAIGLNFGGVSTKESENFDFSFLNNINLDNVESLYFHYAPKNTFSLLKKFTNIKSIGLYDCDNLIDLSFLKGYNSLEKIEIWDAPNLKDISEFEYVSSTITEVYFRNCGSITDISVLKKCSNITKLILKGCPNIKNFDIVSSLKKLTYLSVCNCGLTKKSDYDFLYDISKKDNLIKLILGNDLSDKIFEELKKDEKLNRKFWFIHDD